MFLSSQKIESLPQTKYNFATWSGLLKFITLDCKNIGIRKSEFMTKTKFLFNTIKLLILIYPAICQYLNVIICLE